MDDDGTWDTETEIFATAYLLKTTIMVFTKATENYKWVTHSPSKREKGDSAKKLYLINECNNYEPVSRLCKYKRHTRYYRFKSIMYFLCNFRLCHSCLLSLIQNLTFFCYNIYTTLYFPPRKNVRQASASRLIK